MNLEETLKEFLEQILIKLETGYTKITVTEDDKDVYEINIESDDPSMLIGYHGENIQALQHLLKTLVWKKAENETFNILLDVDGYRKRQEENILALAERKIEAVRTTGRPQKLPPMSPFFRRKIHMLCMSAGYDDIETVSEGDGDRRCITLKSKS